MDAERCLRCQPDNSGSKIASLPMGKQVAQTHCVVVPLCPRGQEGARSRWPLSLGGSMEAARGQPWLWVAMSVTRSPQKEQLEQCYFDSLWNNTLTENETHLDWTSKKFSGQKSVSGWCASLCCSATQSFHIHFILAYKLKALIFACIPFRTC